MNSEIHKALLSRLSQSEDPWVERKASWNDGEARKAMVAFANSIPEGETAVLFIGAQNDGNHPGIPNADDIQKKVKLSSEQCYPPIVHELCVVTVIKPTRETREVLAIMVPFSANRPHFSGQAYIRKGSETIKASDEIFEELIASRNEIARKILRLVGGFICLRYMHESGLWYEINVSLNNCDSRTFTIFSFDEFNQTYLIKESEVVIRDFESPLIIIKTTKTEAQHTSCRQIKLLNTSNQPTTSLPKKKRF